MKTFIINLPKDTGRLRSIQQYLVGKLDDVEVMPAVYGKELCKVELEHLTTEFGRHRLTLSEIGCALSHQKIYQMMVEQHIPMALVLEDDAKPTERVFEVLNFLEQNIDVKRPELFLLTKVDVYRKGMTRQINADFKIAKYLEGALAHGYVVTLAAAERLCQNLRPLELEADFWTVIAYRANIKIFSVIPHVIELSEWAQKSNISHTRSGEGKPLPAIFLSKEQSLRREGKTFYRQWYMSVLKRIGWYVRL